MTLDLDEMEQRLLFRDGAPMRDCEEWSRDECVALIAEVRRLRAEVASAQRTYFGVTAVPLPDGSAKGHEGDMDGYRTAADAREAEMFFGPSVAHIDGDLRRIVSVCTKCLHGGEELSCGGSPVMPCWSCGCDYVADASHAVHMSQAKRIVERAQKRGLPGVMREHRGTVSRMFGPLIQSSHDRQAGRPRTSLNGRQTARYGAWPECSG